VSMQGYGKLLKHLREEHSYTQYEAEAVVKLLKVCSKKPMKEHEQYLDFYDQHFSIEAILKRPSLQFIKYDLKAYNNFEEIRREVDRHYQHTYQDIKRDYFSNKFCHSNSLTRNAGLAEYFANLGYDRRFQLYMLSFECLYSDQKYKEHFDKLYEFEIIQNSDTRLAFCMYNSFIFYKQNFYENIRMKQEQAKRDLGNQWYGENIAKLKPYAEAYMVMLRLVGLDEQYRSMGEDKYFL